MKAMTALLELRPEWTDDLVMTSANICYSVTLVSCSAPAMSQLQLPIFDNLAKENERLRAENAELRQEIQRLRDIVQNSRVDKATVQKASVHQTSLRQSESTFQSADDLITQERIQLFRTLFRGRDDVYATRWNFNDRSGYSPARKHDWNTHTVDKTGRKVCPKTCPTLPMTDEVLREHIAGNSVVGIYPMLPDETCWFLAVDFDKASWQEDVSAFLRACRKLDVPAYLERSRSGNGGHVWIFFDKAIPAIQARQLGAALITSCRDDRYSVSFDSYDRMFPNQDTMPKGNFGNLIALPLQGESVKSNNSVFLTDELDAYEDQWSYLRSIQRMPAKKTGAIVKEAVAAYTVIPALQPSVDEDSKDDPWTLPPSGQQPDKPLNSPLPAVARLVLANQIYIPQEGFSSSALARLLDIGAFQNPEFYQYQAMRMSTFGKPRVISCGSHDSKYIMLPRGCMDKLSDLFVSNNIAVEIKDERFPGKNIDVEFTGTLHAHQAPVAAEILRHENGILSATTAFGKTVLAAHCIAARGVNTLILVHRTQLIDQWRDSLKKFLSISEKLIGQIGDGKAKRTGIIDIATIQSLQRKGVVKDLVAEYGHVVVDECHHIPAFTFEQVLKQVKARFILGLTATPVRKDGNHPIIMMQCGPIRVRFGAKQHLASGIQQHVVIPRFTSFDAPNPNDLSIQELFSLLASDQARNELLFNDILQALEQKRNPIVITDRTEHLDLLANMLTGFAKNIIVFRGGLGKKQRDLIKAKMEAIPKDEERVVLATGRYIGEGFDDARLDTLFLASPISWSGTLEQYAGRLHRKCEGKTLVQIYDYVDAAVPRLNKMYDRRLVGYKKIGYKLTNSSVIAVSNEHL
jgi:superfamily II DNA or RNA helicase